MSVEDRYGTQGTTSVIVYLSKSVQHETCSSNVSGAQNPKRPSMVGASAAGYPKADSCVDDAPAKEKLWLPTAAIMAPVIGTNDREAFG